MKPSSELLTERAAHAALRALCKVLRRAPRLTALKDIYDDLPNRCEAPLPGFNLFTPGGTTPVHTWLLPKRPLSAQDLVFAYESFSDRALGKFRDPGELPESLLAEVGFKVSLGGSGRPADWYTPALRLLALAQRHAGVTATVSPDNVYSLRVGTSYLEVRPEGCYSNYRHMTVKAHRPPEDMDVADGAFQPHVSRSREVAAVLKVCEEAEYAATLALSGVSRAIEAGLLSQAHVWLTLCSESVKLRNQLLPGAPMTPREALDGAVSLIDGAPAQPNYDVMVSMLEDIVVPCLYSRRLFLAKFHSPHGRKPESHVRPETLARWRARVHERYAEVMEKLY